MVFMSLEYRFDPTTFSFVLQSIIAPVPKNTPNDLCATPAECGLSSFPELTLQEKPGDGLEQQLGTAHILNGGK